MSHREPAQSGGFRDDNFVGSPYRRYGPPIWRRGMPLRLHPGRLRRRDKTMNQTLGLDRHHGSPLIRRIATIVPLTVEEQDALAGLTRSPRSFAKGKELVDLGENDSDPFVLLDGFVIA